MIFATIATILANRRPHGPQPVAYGHIQTLADLIDVWTPKMWWGHKDSLKPICHAGMCGTLYSLRPSIERKKITRYERLAPPSGQDDDMVCMTMRRIANPTARPSFCTIYLASGTKAMMITPKSKPHHMQLEDIPHRTISGNLSVATTVLCDCNDCSTLL